MRSVFALYRRYRDLQAALDELLGSHFDTRHMNVVVQENTAKLESMHAGPGSATMEPEQARLAHVLDHLLAGEQPIALTDVGRVLAAGELASILVKDLDTPMSIEDTLEDALLALHLPPQIVKAYVVGIKEGGLLFWIRTTDEQSATVTRIMERHNALFITGNLQTVLAR